MCGSSYQNSIMNLVIILSLIAFSSGAQLNRAYLPPDHAHSSDGSDFLETPIIVPDEEVTHQSVAELNSAHTNEQQGTDEYVQIGNQGHKIHQNIEGHNVVQEVNHFEHFHVAEQSPERSQAALERHAGILRQQFDNNVESYAYVFETENGIYGEESGVATDGVKAHGGFSYMGDDGKQYSITYTADENGFRPQGDHLPTPPPIPDEILKSLEENARDEASGIYDDGSYNEEKYGDETGYKNENALGKTINEPEHVVNEADAIITESAVLPEPALPTVGVIENNELHTVAHIPEPIVPHVNRVYLPPTNYQFTRERTQNGNLGRFINGNDITKTYLPPTHQQTIENRVSPVSNVNQAIENNGARKTYLPPLNNQAINVARRVYLPPVRQQVIKDKTSQNGIIGQNVNNDVRKIYLPPIQRQVQDTISQNGFSKQANHESRKTYLPPVNRQFIENRPSQINQGQAVTSNSARTYLPPKQHLENRSAQNGRLAFGTRNRQPSFDSESGYKY